ncbi:MAG: metal-dependent hydrolase [Flavisolibacter sp.]
MDSLTHIAAGAIIGDALLGKRLGKKAMLLGALAQSIPDLDFATSFWSNASTYLLAHRGFTHSILFAVLTTIGFALLAEHYHRQHKVSYQNWVLFFGVQMAVHLFIDLFNAYGMGLLEPFSHTRFSLNALFVVDPFFSITMAISTVVLLVLRPRIRKRVFWQGFGLILPSLYLVYCVYNKLKIDRDVKEAFLAQHIPVKDYFTTPTPLNNWLWYTVAKSDAGFYVGYCSVFDRTRDMNFTFFPQNNYLLTPVADKEELQHLIRFSKGYYTVEKMSDTLVFNDLRFGQVAGWYDPREKFVFHYYLGQNTNENKLAVQRGRFSKWNAKTVKSLINRIEGN